MYRATHKHRGRKPKRQREGESERWWVEVGKEKRERER
jgi:hypothetical protein